MAIRWFIDLAFVKNVCIGKVHQLSSPEDAGKRIRPASPWQAYGMATDWQDTDLGNQYPSRGIAMKVVEEWYRARIRSQKPKIISCSAHYQFRPGCTGCEALNVERKLE